MPFKTRMPEEEINRRIRAIEGNLLTTFVGYVGRLSPNLKGLFICECGNRHVCRVWHVLSGHTTSCGCAHRGPTRDPDRPRSHPLYTTWIGMHNRCKNPKNASYEYYGARGISVCGRWESFWAFVSDMGPKPTVEHSIERVNNDGNYEPSNCVWATRKEQAKNKRPRGTVKHPIQVLNQSAL